MQNTWHRSANDDFRKPQIDVRVAAKFLKPFKLIWPVQISPKKYFPFPRRQISRICEPSHPQRGGSRSSRTRVEMRWTRQRRARWSSQGGSDRSVSERSGAQDERRFNAFFKTSDGSTWLAEAMSKVAAYGEVVWSWHPLLMSSERRGIGPTGLSTPHQSADDGDKRNSSPGRARRKPLKPLRREGRVSGVPVVTTVCLLPLHTGRGCPRAPGFSCALTLKARNSFHHSDAPRREMAELCLVERLIKYPCASPAPAGPRAGASRRAQRETPAKLRRG
jgi:hypothetical protein